MLYARPPQPVNAQARLEDEARQEPRHPMSLTSARQLSLQPMRRIRIS